MPPLEMRGRYLMREYWSDTDLHTRTTAEVREFYQGLWMLADDEGWMPRDVVGIGAALFRFQGPNERAEMVRAGLDRLRDLGKVKSLRCGCLFLPAVARYPRAGKKNTVHLAAHQTHLNDIDAKDQPKSKRSKGIQTDLKPSPVPSLPDPSRPARATRDGSANKGGFGGKLPPFDQLVKPV